MFKIDLSRLEEILAGEQSQEPTSNVPSFVDSSSEPNSDNPLETKLSPETRMQNMEVNINNLYTLAQRLGDEMRIQRESLNELKVRVQFKPGMTA